MKIHEIYNQYIYLWPERIRIDDGYVCGNGFMFPTLNEIHHAIEERIDHSKDHWGNIFTWSMFQAFHNLAIELLDKGYKEIITSAVSLNSIGQCVIRNLSGDGWKEQLALYLTLKESKKNNE